MKKLDAQGSYIAGRGTKEGDTTFTTRFPGTGEELCQVHETSSAEIERAVDSAREGFRVWSKSSVTDRARVLGRAAEILRTRLKELAELEVLDTGKPIAEANAVDVTSGADALEYFAGLAHGLHGQHFDLGKSFAYTRREPLGVCFGIGAWNYPLQIACWKAAPALACGNAMIFKPSELTPLTALRLAEVFSEAGLPAGVFNVVQGGARVGQALCRHPGVAKVSLTGSVATGRAVMAEAARTLKHVTMELGGKSPLIIFADADLEQAVSAALLANFYTQGEICSNGTRVFVEEKIATSFVETLVKRVERLRVGDPLDPKTQIGALISAEHREKVLRYIETGKREGAHLAIGGEAPRFTGAESRLGGGYFVRPTVFDRCEDKMTLVREEIFGPVMSVLTFQSEDEVLARANATEFGLASGVFTRDLQRGHRMAAALETGICWINNYNITPIQIPFGGSKQSGIGRENSHAAIEAYTQLKSVYVEMGQVDGWA